jgi:hypothetical protein
MMLTIDETPFWTCLLFQRLAHHTFDRIHGGSSTWLEDTEGTIGIDSGNFWGKAKLRAHVTYLGTYLGRYF